MSTTIDRNQSVESESAILVGVLLPEHPPTEDPLEELGGLVETAGAEIVGRLTQNRQAPDKTTYLGSGKVEDLGLIVKATDADVVIFDNDLSPAQVRNLEEALGVKVLDRTEVILDIFSSRAQTHEARLAVELAQLEYSLPRLKRMWTHLSRMKMGVGMRGPGEKQLETDRRLVEKRISDLKRDLDQILKRKEREVGARKDRMTVSLVGYTNAGKSTLMNALTDSTVLAEDKLFATLDTRTRRWRLPGWGPVLLSDTVGFIKNLPHRLIASFKATLEEARQADLLIHVADASNPAVSEQISAVYGVLKELQIEEKDTLLVLNKVDQVASPMALEAIRNRYPNAVAISARGGTGLTEMAQAVSEAISSDFLDLEIVLPVSDGRTTAFLAKFGDVKSQTYSEENTTVHCRLDRKYLGQLEDTPGIEIRQRNECVGKENSDVAGTAAKPQAAGGDAIGEVA
ncbi:GTPase HflX [Adhaeretor mobilis]|uniref:GTPase HflX n=1 Tax=Adhaeretor mobilis TaxID=1930276 RepID=A0A517MVN1_9BACT|nr:GTPase HflX [Adhaeretor mobilis]QDS98935.1 GTPase HflX [Adhaeretor mobilis]